MNIIFIIDNNELFIILGTLTQKCFNGNNLYKTYNLSKYGVTDIRSFQNQTYQTNYTHLNVNAHLYKITIVVLV